MSPSVTASPIVGLGYLVVGAPTTQRWAEFGADVLGMSTSSTTDGAVELRADHWEWRIRAERAHAEGLLAVGVHVRNVDALSALVARLSTAGFPATTNNELAESRRVGDVYVVDDPDGNRLELFVGPTIAANRFISPTGARFVTDANGLGHILFAVDDIHESRRFYVDGLGMAVSDEIRTGGRALGCFVGSGTRHHSFAFLDRRAMPPGGPPADAGPQHIMVEVDELDQVGRVSDLLHRDPAMHVFSLGRHTNDHMCSCYLKSPSGFAVEYGFDGRTMGGDSPVIAHAKGSVWGHQRLRRSVACD